MKKLKPWLVVILVFAAGFAGGVVVTRATIRHFVRQAMEDPSRVRGLIERRVMAQLDLTADQRQEVRKILTARQADLRQLRTEFQPRFLQIVTNGEAQISAVLTPEQREKFDKMREENRQFWPRKGEGNVRRRE